MHLLQQLARQDPHWSLDDLVDVANQLLPQFLPDQGGDSRLQDQVNARLVRHYTTQGLLDKPLKQGREARYLYRHLLQLLLLRRLLAEGYSSGSLGPLVLSKTNQEIESLLQGGAQLTVEAANPALAFLAQVRERSTQPGDRTGLSPQRGRASQASPDPPAPSPSTPSPSAPSPSAPSPTDFAALSSAAPPAAPAQWTRQTILEGLEIHIREDFVYPNNPHEREALLQLIAAHLINPHTRRRTPP
jgi:DNA-binding transcriptional MerR regulator